MNDSQDLEEHLLCQSQFIIEHNSSNYIINITQKNTFMEDLSDQELINSLDSIERKGTASSQPEKKNHNSINKEGWQTERMVKWGEWPAGRLTDWGQVHTEGRYMFYKYIVPLSLTPTSQTSKTSHKCTSISNSFPAIPSYQSRDWFRGRSVNPPWHLS